MKWYYKVLGGHTHVRVFINGLAGDLCFRNEEFNQIKADHDELTYDKEDLIVFINEEKPAEEPTGLTMGHVLKCDIKKLSS